jgi:hypothetical protein
MPLRLYKARGACSLVRQRLSCHHTERRVTYMTIVVESYDLECDWAQVEQRSVVGRIKKVKNVGLVDGATQGKIADQQKNVGDQR